MEPTVSVAQLQTDLNYQLQLKSSECVIIKDPYTAEFAFILINDSFPFWSLSPSSLHTLKRNYTVGKAE